MTADQENQRPIDLLNESTEQLLRHIREDFKDSDPELLRTVEVMIVKLLKVINAQHYQICLLDDYKRMLDELEHQ